MLKLFKKTPSYVSNKHQLELGVQRAREADRNYDKGGRSFYFFDFDDNIAVLGTSTVIFHKDTGHELHLSTREFGEQSRYIGKSGPYKDYEIRLEDSTGSFQYFRDREMGILERLVGRRQIFVRDLLEALRLPEHHWQGPSWNCFYHAVYNRRPISLITARGHHPETIKEGVRLFVEHSHIPHEPNYLAIFPINHLDTRASLQQGPEVSVAEMKQAAIRASVKAAFDQYGYNEHHQFGMSDDDPRNVELIIEEMAKLKREYPNNSFFVFDTHKGQFLRREVLPGSTRDQVLSPQAQQLSLF